MMEALRLVRLPSYHYTNAFSLCDFLKISLGNFRFLSSQTLDRVLSGLGVLDLLSRCGTYKFFVNCKN